MLEGERAGAQSGVFALHDLKSLSLSLSHARAMCGRHVTCLCRKHRSESASMQERRGREGKGGRRRKERTRREAVKIRERIKREREAGLEDGRENFRADF